MSNNIYGQQIYGQASNAINKGYIVPQVNESSKLTKQNVLYGRTKPMNQSEIEELNSYESAICKIKFKACEKGQIINRIGTGFFLEINDANIPFKKALFTNNHVLDENSIEMHTGIEFEYCKNLKKIKITENRKAFTNKQLDYTCIEIFDTVILINFLELMKQLLIIKIY